MSKVSIPDEKLFKYSFYRAGTKIFSQGDSGTDIFILKKGAVTVSVDGQLVGLINSPDTIIGEMSYFLGNKRTATVEAVEDSEFIVIPGDYLYDTILKKPEIGIQLLKILAIRLKNTTKYVSKLEKEIEELRNKLRKLEGLQTNGQKQSRIEHELVNFGFVSEEQLDECMRELEERKKKNENVSILKILIDKGYLTTEQIIHYVDTKKGF